MKTFITARMDQTEIKRLTAAGFKVEQGGFALTGVKMDKDSLISKLADAEVAIIEYDDGSFTSMLKSTYEAQQAEQSTPNLAP